ncbi:MAG: VanZ family protein [Algoriphagus sp.]|nr:VanZ family protein [Algoriphagus sp.]
MRLFLAVSWLIFLSLAMLTPGKSLPDVNLFDFQDKLIHLLCFITQSYLWCGIGVDKSGKIPTNKRLWFNFAMFGILIGIFLETAQLLIPNRAFEWMDLIVNIFGGFIGFLAYLRWPSIKFILE